jgi:hypothetical protein
MSRRSLRIEDILPHLDEEDEVSGSEVDELDESNVQGLRDLMEIRLNDEIDLDEVDFNLQEEVIDESERHTIVATLQVLEEQLVRENSVSASSVVRSETMTLTSVSSGDLPSIEGRANSIFLGRAKKNPFCWFSNCFNASSIPNQNFTPLISDSLSNCDQIVDFFFKCLILRLLRK